MAEPRLSAAAPAAGRPLHLILSTWLAESAWGYLMVNALVASTNPGSAIGPGAVLAPYGLALAMTALLGKAAPGTSEVAGRRPFLAAVLDFLWKLAVALLYLLAGLICLAAIAWRELYPAFGFLDRAWLSRLMVDSQGQLNTIPLVAWLTLLVGLLWWRGTHLARREGSFPELSARFLWGSAALLGVAFLGGDLSPASPYSIWAFAAYVMFGLTAVAIARLRAAQQDRLGGVDSRWEEFSPVLVLLLLAIGFALPLLLLPQIQALAAWLWDLWTGALLPALLETLRWIAHILGLDKPPAPLPIDPNPGSPSGPRDMPSVLVLPDSMREVGRQLFTLVWIVIILVGLYSWISNWFWERRRGSGGGVRRERIPWRFSIDLKGLLYWLLRGLLYRWPSLSRRLHLPDMPGNRARTAQELYRRLLAWGARRGRPRQPWATPGEYQAILSDGWPELAGDFRTLTEGFHLARYGGSPLGREDLEAALEGWGRIKAAPRKKRR